MGSASLKSRINHLTHKQETWTAPNIGCKHTLTDKGLVLAGCNAWLDGLTFHGYYLSLHTSGEQQNFSHIHQGWWQLLTHNFWWRSDTEARGRGQQQWCGFEQGKKRLQLLHVGLFGGGETLWLKAGKPPGDTDNKTNTQRGERSTKVIC